jgi:hypothetical protein
VRPYTHHHETERNAATTTKVGDLMGYDAERAEPENLRNQ